MENNLERDEQLAEAQREIEEQKRQAILEQQLERQMERNAGYGE